MSYQVVTIGAATQDVFLISKNFRPFRYQGGLFNMLEYGSKIDVSDIVYDTGGGATNSAVTFARQGLQAACITKIGIDAAGREVLRALKREGINTDHVIKNTTHHTGFSALLKPYTGDRTVLVHRGASFDYNKKDLNLSKLNAKWFYITSLGGNLPILRLIVDFAHRQGIYVAYNPGSLEIKKGKRLLPLLKKCQVVQMNMDEAGTLTGHEDPHRIMGTLQRAGLHTVLVTAGPRGSYCLYNSRLYHSGLYKKVRIVDRTGAGDAYGSGFVASLIRGKTIEDSMAFAAANSTSVISYIGAKTGILRTHDVRPMKIYEVGI